MKIITAKTQLTLGLVCMQMSVLCGAMLFGLVPEQRSAVLSGRADLCESVAIVSSQFMAKGQTEDLKTLLNQIVERNSSVQSAAIRKSDGTVIAEIGEHEEFWTVAGQRSSENEVLVPIQANHDSQEASRWGNVELRFTKVSESGLASFHKHPWVRMTLFVSAISAVMFYFYLRKMLKHLDPSKAVPKRVRAALDSLAEGLLVLDQKQRIVLANEAFAEWVGAPAEELTGVDANAFDWVLKQADKESTGYPWVDALTQESAQIGVMIGLQPNGAEEQSLMANAAPVMGQDGKFGGVLVSFDDVTQLEETRRDLSAAKEVAETAQSRAEEADRAKSDFLARMSHEIRTPMNAILGYTEVLRSGANETAAERGSYLNTIHASGEHLLALINDILDLSKIESGQMELDNGHHSLPELIHQVVAVMDVKAKEKSIGLRFEGDGLIPETVLTDAVRFRQTVFNLVGNAVKFTEKGEVKIVVSVVDGLLKVDVVDTGVGIAADAVDKVFEEFTQADASVSTKFGGTGLGLSISKQLARMMGGDITVSSILGTGSTFTLTINPGSLEGVKLIDPAVETVKTTDHQNLADELQLPPCRILIVDDEKANRGLAGIHIRRAGGTYAEACDGLEAVKAASEEHFDLILMDFNMPVMGGLDATRKLRSLGVTTPVIALTANVMQDDKDMAAEAGCDGFLTKPIKLKDLINGINELLPEELHEKGRELRAASEAAEVESQLESLTRAQRPPTDLDTLLNSIAPESQVPHAPVAANDDPLPETEPATEALPTPAAIEPLVSTLPTDDPEFYAIVAGFPPRLLERVQQMKDCLASGDLPSLKQHAHWLAGTGETVGFAAFTVPARSLEAAAKEERTEGLAELVAELDQLAQRVVVNPPVDVVIG